MKTVIQIAAIALAIFLLPVTSKAQSPTGPALNFNAFILHDVKMTQSEMEGPLAIGGDLKIAGDYNVSAHNAGTFQIGGIPIALVVNGEVHFQSGNSFKVLQNGYAKIANCGSSTVWYHDLNNAYPPIRITPGSNYNGAPRIEFSQNAQAWGVSTTVNPICETTGLNFDSTFIRFKANALNLSNCTDNTILKTPNGTLLGRTNLPSQVKIYLHSGANVLNISGAEWNNIDVFIFQGTDPGPDNYLIVNIDNQATGGIYNWDALNVAGFGGLTECKYILYNFYNTDTLNILNTSHAIEGTVFAPYADIVKNNNANIEGQVIGNSYTQNGGGEIHYAVFQPDYGGCPTITPTVSGFSINDSVQCLAGNVFQFTNNSTGDSVSYLWHFGNNDSSTDSNPTVTYDTAGIYAVQLIATGTNGSDTITKTVNVIAMPDAQISSNDTLQYQSSNQFLFDVINPLAGQSYGWDFGDSTSSSIQNPSKTYDSAGSYWVRLTVSNSEGCTSLDSIHIFVVSDSVGTGHDGGLESKSMGGLVGKRDFNRIRNSIDTRIDYNKMPLFSSIMREIGTGTEQKLVDMMPQELMPGDQLRVSTPSDLLTLTAAKAVLSIDYTRNNKAQAVALGIKTLSKAYSHTKSICDRFKGASLVNVDTVEIKGFKFLRFSLKMENGMVEYAIAFVVGSNENRDYYTLQTNWLISEYNKDETIFNFQVWSARPDYTNLLVGEIIDNLTAYQNVQQTKSSNPPPAYIVFGKRNLDNLEVSIRNNTTAQNAKLVFEERKNEQAEIDNLETPMQLSANGSKTFNIPIKDGYEYQGYLYLDGVLVDEVYFADGNWGIDFDNSYTKILNFNIDNNPGRIYHEDEYPMYRNSSLKAMTNDYVSVYKAIRPGTEATDLTAYHSLKFFAKGNGKLEIKLTKGSIIDWNAQYKTEINLDENGRNYAISYKDFSSDKYSQPFSANDLKTVVFSFLDKSGKIENVDFAINDLSFSKEKVPSLNGLDAKELHISPNPSNGTFNCYFMASAAQSLTLRIMDATGRLLYSTTVNATIGQNIIPVHIETSASVVLVSLTGNGISYLPQKISIY